jgi:hypothetical protein
MNDGVVLWLQGLSSAEAEALMATLTDGAWWTTEGAAVCALAPQPGEHLSAGVNRALNTAIMASQRQAAVGLAVGPLPVGGRANPTLERARRAAALAAGSVESRERAPQPYIPMANIRSRSYCE